ncbi:MAG: type IV pilin protein [Actinomycetes bacterium]
MPRPRASADDGFTLVEVMTTVVIFGILTAAAVWAWKGYTKATQESGTATSVVETLRNAQERAQAEDTNYCVRFTAGATTWTLYRSACGTGTVVDRGSTEANTVVIATASFDDPSTGVTSSDVVFTPRGVSSGGNLTITRTGASKVYQINVVGLTGRVCEVGVDAQCST